MTLKKGIVIGIVVIVLYGILGLPLVAGAQDAYEPALGDKPAGTEIIFDLALVRPLGLVGLALGTSVFILSLPFTLVTGSAKDAADALVDEPFNFTFVRPMGQY